MKKFDPPKSLNEAEAVLSSCEEAVRQLGILVDDVQHAAQSCDHDWSSSLVQHVLHVFGLLSAELGYKVSALALLDSVLKDAASENDDTFEDGWQFATIANWICNRPGDMLPLIQEMLSGDEESDEVPPSPNVATAP